LDLKLVIIHAAAALVRGPTLYHKGNFSDPLAEIASSRYFLLVNSR
jgi:hypothetical protein